MIQSYVSGEAHDRRPLGVAGLAPALFVLLWSTGFIGAKLGLPYAEPMTFLLLRFALLVGLTLAIALALRAPWPATPAQWWHIAIAGLLIQAGYLGGVFAAIDHGLSAGMTALIGGLQPLLTVVAAAPLLGERTSSRQWLGFVLGFIGVVLAVFQRLEPGAIEAVALAVFALICITAGTLYQKRFCAAMDLRSGAAIQFGASALVLLIIAPLTETMHVEWTGEFVFALLWLTLVLSLGAMTLLWLLLRHNEASRVSAMFYLVPATTALIGFAVFDERLDPLAILGFVVASTGVALVTRR
ncbi:MAG: DMT family transporter [Burkholderiales bacterium]